MARRVNTKFLVILTSVVVGLLAVAVVAAKFLIASLRRSTSPPAAS
jgi:hypothetical protein